MNSVCPRSPQRVIPASGTRNTDHCNGAFAAPIVTPTLPHGIGHITPPPAYPPLNFDSSGEFPSNHGSDAGGAERGGELSFRSSGGVRVGEPGCSSLRQRQARRGAGRHRCVSVRRGLNGESYRKKATACQMAAQTPSDRSNTTVKDAPFDQ